MNGFWQTGLRQKTEGPKRIGSGALRATDARFPAKIAPGIPVFALGRGIQSFINVSFQLLAFVALIWWSRVVCDNCFSWPNSRHMRRVCALHQNA